MRTWASLIVLAAAASSCTSRDEHLPQDTRSPKGGQQAWETSLFDGKSLHGWNIENGCEAAAENGVLVLKAGNGWLRSEEQYADFTWHVEWKAVQEHGYDSGLYIRTEVGGAPFPKNSYQINLLEGQEGNIKNLPGTVSRGLVKAGEWNTFDIRVEGDTVALAINGQSAYKAGGLVRAQGYLGLQCEVTKGGQFQFRDLRLTLPEKTASK